MAMVFMMALAPGLAGCTYVCHTYQVEGTEETFVPPVGRIGPWKVYVGVDRWRGASQPYPPPGSWPHWPASDDDIYRIDVSPVADDSTVWEGVEIEIGPARVTYGDSVTTVAWAETEDVRIGDFGYLNSYLQYARAYSPLRFVSEAFRLPVPVPEALGITFEVRVVESATGRELHRKTFTARAVLERHRRWGIADAIES
jgi:hypothetical protein